MYVAEVYLTDNFTFLFIKYCIGFLFVLLVPVIALILEGDIRKGIRSVSQLCFLPRFMEDLSLYSLCLKRGLPQTKGLKASLRGYGQFWTTFGQEIEPNRADNR